MSIQDWKPLLRKAWGNEYDYLQIYRFAKKGESRYTYKNSNKTNYKGCTPETAPF